MDLVETQGIFITPSELIEYIYCARFIFFMNCLSIPQHEEKRYKVLIGREIHEERRRLNPNYLRKKLGCVNKDTDVYMVSESEHIKGKVDEVLYLSDGTLAPLDYKWTEYKEFAYKTHRYQSVLYAMLIRENYKKEVKSGFLCYTRDKYKIKEVLFSENDFHEAKQMIEEMLKIIQFGHYPKKTKFQIRCIDCCYKNICV